MLKDKYRVALFTAAHLLFLLVLVPTATPSDSTALETIRNAPDASDLALFEELAEWIDEEPTSADAEPLREVIRERATSFDVFRSYHDEESRQERLSAVPYGQTIHRAASRYQVDSLLIASIIEVESHFDPTAVSHKGALGLMQVMPLGMDPATATRLLSPEINIDHGTRYLRHLLESYDGDLEMALAAYNAGPGNVRRYGGLPPFRETRNYVEKVLSRYIEHHRDLWRESETGEILTAS